MDDTDGTDRIDRRTWLAAAGTALASLTAGCNEGGSTTNDGSSGDDPGGSADPGDASTNGSDPEPAAFSEVTLETPSSVTLREELTVTVSATNTGGQPGTYTDTLRLVEGSRDFEQAIEIPEVGPGETGSTEVALTFDYRDRYVFGLGQADATAPVEPEMLRLSRGDSLDVREQLRLTLEGVTFEETLPVRVAERGYYVNQSGNGVYRAPADDVFALLRFSLENTGSEADSLPFASFAGPTDTVVEAISFENDYGIGSVTYEQRPLITGESRQLAPGQTVNGWLLLRVPRDEARDGVSVQYQANTAQTPPEAEFTVTPESDEFTFPSFELVDTQIEDATIERETDMQVVFTVRNTGDGPGRFAGVLQNNPERWLQENTAQSNTFLRTISPGETETFTTIVNDGDTSNDNTYTRTYRFSPFDDTFEVTFREPSR